MKRIKRFYDTVSISNIPQTCQYNLLLNNKTVKTPLGELLVFPSEGIASAVAMEWELQTEFVIPNTMPINTIMMTYIDVDSKILKKEKLDQIRRFLQTDTIRFPHLDPTSPLVSAQQQYWSKLESYLATRGITMTKSLNGIAIPPETDAEIEKINSEILSQYDPLKLTMLEVASKYLKSGTIGIGLLDGVLTPSEAFKAAYVEEICQRQEWGEVEGDHDINDAETMLWLNGISILGKLVK